MLAAYDACEACLFFQTMALTVFYFKEGFILQKASKPKNILAFQF